MSRRRYHDEHVDLEAGPSPRHPGSGRLGQVLLVVATGVPALATLVGYLGRLWWPLDLFAHFRLQYALVLAVAIVVCLVARRWRLSALLALPLLLNLLSIAPLYRAPATAAPVPSSAGPSWAQVAATQPAEPTQDDAAPPVGAEEPALVRKDVPRPLRVLNFSVELNERTDNAVLAYLSDAKVDVIVLQGVTPEALEFLEYRVAPFRVYFAEPRDDRYGMALLVQIAMRAQVRLEEARRIHLTPEPLGIPAIEARLRWGHRRFMLLALHAAAPRNAQAAYVHERQLAAAASWARAQPYPPIIMGDLGSTPWSYRFRRLVEQSGLVNSQRGFGLQPTWPSNGGPLGQIPIDHLLHDPCLVTLERRLGPSLGSDHRPLWVKLIWSDEVNVYEEAPPAPGIVYPTYR